MLEEVKKRINALGIEISFDDEVVAHLAKEGFDPVYGSTSASPCDRQKSGGLLLGGSSCGRGQGRRQREVRNA